MVIKVYKVNFSHLKMKYLLCITLHSSYTIKTITISLTNFNFSHHRSHRKCNYWLSISKINYRYSITYYVINYKWLISINKIIWQYITIILYSKCLLCNGFIFANSVIHTQSRVVSIKCTCMLARSHFECYIETSLVPYINTYYFYHIGSTYS